MGFFKGISKSELHSLIETHKSLDNKLHLMDDIDEMYEEINRYEKALNEIANHKEIFGYTPTNERCANIAKRALDLTTAERK